MLVSWLGRTDLNASKDNAQVGLGPLAQAVQQRCFDRLILLNNYPKAEADAYLHWIESLFPSLKFDVQHISLSGPTNYDEIYRSVFTILEDTKKTHPYATFTFHLDPGTPAMAAVWIILAKTYFPAELSESSREHGVKIVNFPFDLSAEFLPDSLKARDARLVDLSASLPPKAPAFEDIVYRCESMDRLILKARKVSLRSVPVLIEGESGTGKELLARAIHKAGPRCKKPFIAVNCGAIPSELVESELFGHAKGAFTGAEKSRTGYFEAAQNGTLFLDEIGELPLRAQVKVLRSLQENEVLRVGTTQPISLDIRVIAATNRDLIKES